MATRVGCFRLDQLLVERTADPSRYGRDDKGECGASISFSRWLRELRRGRGLLHVEEAALDCDHDCVRTIAGSELGENALEMSLDGVL
jgi:hypothetical protein